MCLEFHKPFIIGTTGFSEGELKSIKELCDVNNVKGVICYNFAIPINYLFSKLNNFFNYFEEITFFDIHHVSKKDKKSGTSYVVSSINNNIKVKSYQSNSKVITYVFQLKTKCDKIIITYQVNDKIAFAYGLLEYIKFKNENSIINLITIFLPKTITKKKNKKDKQRIMRSLYDLQILFMRLFQKRKT